MENLKIMIRSIATSLKSLAGCLASPFLRSYARSRLQSKLTDLPEPEIDRLLGLANMTRADVLIRTQARASYRLLMVRMLPHFGLDLNRVVRHDWTAMRQAESRCADCHNRGRCRRWIACRWHNGAPSVFCPNAAVFQALAREINVTE